jgi:hypothetical protein
MELLLAIGITLCALCIIILQARNNQLHSALDAWKNAYHTANTLTREWEDKYWSVVTNTPADGMVSKRGRDVEPIDPDRAMSESDDPIWRVVEGCRATGVMSLWLHRVRPDLNKSQPHVRYSEFATWLLQLPEDKQNVAGARDAVMV